MIATQPEPPGSAPVSLRGGLTPVRLSVSDVRSMVASGVVPDDCSTELIDGLLVVRDRGLGDRPMASPEHSFTVKQLRLALERQLPDDRLQVHAESDAEVSSHNLPQPDVTVAAGGPMEYAHRYPLPADIRLVAEVANTSLDRDRGLKLRMYAAAGLSPYLIVNMLTRRVEVYERPEDGGYANRREVGEGETLTLELAGEPVTIDVSTLLPPD